MDSKRKFILPVLISGCLMGTLFNSCLEPSHPQTPQVDIWTSDTTVYLKEGLEKPSCKFYMELAYLKPVSETDSISAKINSCIQKEILGEEYATLSPVACGKAIQDKYLTDYTTSVKKLFDADLHNGMKENEIPGWYNYEYEFTSSLEMGYDSIWNYTFVDFSYTGGAHPNTWRLMLNVDAVSGQALTREDVFQMDKKNEICALILNQLIKEVNERMETDTITTVEHLNEVGILQSGALDIPDNFLLEKEGVTFCYNRYEIAPYALGEFILTVPYDEISAYLKRNQTN